MTRGIFASGEAGKVRGYTGYEKVDTRQWVRVTHSACQRAMRKKNRKNRKNSNTKKVNRKLTVVNESLTPKSP